MKRGSFIRDGGCHMPCGGWFGFRPELWRESLLLWEISLIVFASTNHRVHRVPGLLVTWLPARRPLLKLYNPGTHGAVVGIQLIMVAKFLV